MHKPIVESFSDNQFRQIIESSFNLSEAAKTMGFTQTPGKSSRQKIYNRMCELNISFKVFVPQQFQPKHSLYTNDQIDYIGRKAFEFLCSKNTIPFYYDESGSLQYQYLININGSLKKVKVSSVEFMQIRNDSILFPSIIRERL